MKTFVLDPSALLALFFDEPGADRVERLLAQAAEADRPLLVSAVNWAEVLYRLAKRIGDRGSRAARDFECTMPIQITPVDRDQAEAAARLKHEKSLGLADAFAAALAQARKAELVTGDTEFRVLEKDIKIVWLKQP